MFFIIRIVCINNSILIQYIPITFFKTAIQKNNLPVGKTQVRLFPWIDSRGDQISAQCNGPKRGEKGTIGPLLVGW